MDNIILTYKDADFIANIIRTHISDLGTAYNETLKEGNKRADLAKKLVAQMFPDDEKLKKKIAELDETMVKGKQNLEVQYQSRLEKYEKAIELLMTGSV